MLTEDLTDSIAAQGNHYRWRGRHHRRWNLRGFKAGFTSAAAGCSVVAAVAVPLAVNTDAPPGARFVDPPASVESEGSPVTDVEGPPPVVPSTAEPTDTTPPVRVRPKVDPLAQRLVSRSSRSVARHRRTEVHPLKRAPFTPVPRGLPPVSAPPVPPSPPAPPEPPPVEDPDPSPDPSPSPSESPSDGLETPTPDVSTPGPSTGPTGPHDGPLCRTEPTPGCRCRPERNQT